MIKFPKGCKNKENTKIKLKKGKIRVKKVDMENENARNREK